ncbi:MAG: isoprenylcysteine carboxylmethyltransferase family protein [Anaerolineae bacterium]|nr:isoprenylcysteine carboxylmethyltransferase family protein [Anaerolineae bacterium]
MNQSGFWWILIAGAVYGVIHSLTASLWSKQFVARRFGEPGRSYYRLAFVIISLITTPLYAALVLLLPDARLYAIPQPWIFITGFFQLLSLAGILLSFTGTGLLTFIGLDSLPPKTAAPAKNTLMTSGLYKYSRHPIYFFSLIFLWLIPLMSWNILALAIGVTFYTLIGSRFEERKLVGEFGQAYIDYRKVTPWIIPFKLK